MFFEEFFNNIKNISYTHYYISFVSEREYNRIGSWSVYSSIYKTQIIEKILKNNFKKVYIKINFKNDKAYNDKVKNIVIFELDLIQYKNRLKIKSVNCLLYLKNNSFVKFVIEMFKDYGCLQKLNIVEKDIDHINFLNIRKPIKINKLKSENLKEMVYKESNNDLFKNIYDKESQFELKLHYTLFGNYIEYKKIVFTIKNYSKMISNIEKEISNYNSIIRNNYMKERKFFRDLLDNKHVILDSISKIKNTDDLISLLKEFRKLNSINSNKEQLFTQLKFFQNSISKFPATSNNLEYNEFQKRILQISNNNIELVKIDREFIKRFGHQTSFNLSETYNMHWNAEKRHLKFKILNFYLYVDVSTNTNYDFNKIKQFDIIFNLLEKLVANSDIIDCVEKLYFKSN